MDGDKQLGGRQNRLPLSFLGPCAVMTLGGRQPRWQLHVGRDGQRVDDPGWLHDSIGGGFFNVDYLITWKTPNGSVLGTSYIDFAHAQDDQCSAGTFCWIEYYGGQYGVTVS